MIEGQDVWPACASAAMATRIRSCGGKPPVNHVTIVAQQAQPVVMNDRGEGTVTLPIGDLTASCEVMARHWTADDFGSSEDKVVVAPRSSPS
ncbi:hypothetical protein MJ575_21800 [Klebsiella pneumoniae]|nr:hypothetical protein MJ575_21800 [Klebsiella pneumoniae]